MITKNRYKTIIAFLFASFCGNFAEATEAVVVESGNRNESTLKKQPQHDSAEEHIPEGITPEEWARMKKADEQVEEEIGQTEKRNKKEKNR